MPSRAVWLVLLSCLGCQGVIGIAVPPAAPQRISTDLRHADDASHPAAEESAAPEPQRPTNNLSRAAAHLARGEDPQACVHLENFIADHPEHRNARFLYAELLFRQQKRADAQAQYERSILCDQELPEPDVQSLIHCHGRLAVLAEAADDEHDIHLHRGIGLFWLAQARAKLDDPSGDLSVEGLLCRAAGELTTAQSLKPDEARSSWYLHRLWKQLGQPQLTRRWLNEASRATSATGMTRSEQRDLHLACEVSAATRRP